MLQRILIVDDEEVFSDILCRSLTREGYDVDCAATIDEAKLKLCEKEYHSVIVDLRIGDESGLTLVKHVNSEHQAIKIVVLTGYSSIATAVEAIKLGAVHYLTKPAEIEDILAAFEKVDGNEQIKPAESPLSVQRLEWEHIQKVLQKFDGNISAAARAMGMHRRTLQRKLQKKPVKN